MNRGLVPGPDASFGDINNMAGNKKRIKIRDIADNLGVSPATVSRALNPNTEHMIRKEVVAGIKDAARELGYIPSPIATALRTDRTYTVGVAVPDILNPVFPPIINGIQDYLHQNGYLTLIVNTNNDQQVALDEIRRLITRQVDGFILANAFLDDRSVRECLLHGIPMVLVNRSITSGNLVHQVLSDDSFGIELAINHLLELGHTHLLHLAGPPKILHGKQRLKAFRQLCRKNKIREEHMVMDAFSVDAGARGARRFLQQRSEATAILAGNDLMAVGAMDTLQNAGVSVPGEISVVGFNNMPLSDMLSPALTTISIPHWEFGNQAARLLLQVIASPDISRQLVLLTPKLVIRESTAKRRSR